MNSLFISIPLFAWFQRLARRMQQARRARRELQELAHMSAHELRDLGISHAVLAAATRDEFGGA